MAHVFDELLALCTPERLLHDPRATGEGVSVCILDSGVERAVLEQKFRQAGQEIHPIQGGVFTAEDAEDRGEKEVLPRINSDDTDFESSLARSVLSVQAAAESLPELLMHAA